MQIISAIAMIGLVLVQHGKGADMGASFGSGASGSLFGASGSANFLSRSTSFCAAVFFACTLGLAYFGTAGCRRSGPKARACSSARARPARRGAASAPPVAQIPTAPTAGVCACGLGICANATRSVRPSETLSLSA